MRAQDPGDRFAAIVRDLENQSSAGATTDRIAEVAAEVISGCDHAAISLITSKRIDTVAATDETARTGDQHQYEVGEGPCLDSIREQQTVSSPRLRSDRRWPTWAPWVSQQLGVQAMLCFQLFTTEHPYGGLNLSGDREDGFDAHDEVIGLALAAHAAVAVASSHKIEHLNIGLLTRTVIGQAEGILMERFELTAERAFDVLARVSQAENRRLIRVAEELVQTRETPGATH